MLRWSLSRTRIPIVALAVSLWLPASPALAQSDGQPPAKPQGGEKTAAAEDRAKETRHFFPALVHNLGDDVWHIPSKNSLYWLAAGSAMALGIHGEDGKINRRLVGSDVADTLFKPGKYIGSFPFLLGTAVAAYAVGRHNGEPRAQHLGMDLIESAILSGVITEAIKVSVRRDRPVRSDGSRAGGYAFPSGHATMTFAAATVLQQHLGWRWAVPTCAIASYVAISRLHDNRHFASDVAFGATDGIIIGRSVIWHGRNFYASPMLLPKGSGIVVAIRP